MSALIGLTVTMTLLSPQHASANTCEEAFAHRHILTYRNSSPEPTFHIASVNFAERMSWIGRRVEVLGSFENFEPRHNPEKYFLVQTPIKLKFKSFSLEDKILVLADPLHERHFKVEEGDRVLILTEFVAPPRTSEMPSDPPKSFNSETVNSNAFMEQHVRMHLQSSSTAQKGKGVEELIRAYSLMLKKVVSNSAWTHEDLELLNRVLNVPDRRVHWAQDYLKFGVLRGTRKKVLLDAEGYEARNQDGTLDRHFFKSVTEFSVDMREAQEVDHNNAYYYLPAKDVPAAIERWLKIVNSVNEKTSIRKIVSLYREFILIHPFADGNGRTSRLLLDAMLMKAKFGPLPTNSPWVREILYTDIDTFTSKLIESYASQGI